MKKYDELSNKEKHNFEEFLITTFKFSEDELAAIDKQKPMTMELFSSCLAKCTEWGLYKLFERLCELNPSKKLAQSAPSSYDNNDALMKNLLSNEQQDLAREMESTGITYQLVSRFLTNARTRTETGDARIRRVLTYIQKNIHTTMDIDSLSNLSCLSKDHFIRLFKREMKVTPIQYINQKKMEKAQLMLTTQDTPVKDIAYLLGYDNYSYFIRIFKKKLGVTPQEYKKDILRKK